MQKYLYILFFLVFLSHLLYAQKTDTVFFQNGNKITGEVKIMENNKLDLSTDTLTYNLEGVLSSKTDWAISLLGLEYIF